LLLLLLFTLTLLSLTIFFSLTSTSPTDIYTLSLHDALPIYYIVRKLSSKFLTNAHSLLQGNCPDHLQASHYFLVLDHKRFLFVELKDLHQYPNRFHLHLVRGLLEDLFYFPKSLEHPYLLCVPSHIIYLNLEPTTSQPLKIPTPIQSLLP